MINFKHKYIFLIIAIASIISFLFCYAIYFLVLDFTHINIFIYLPCIWPPVTVYISVYLSNSSKFTRKKSDFIKSYLVKGAYSMLDIVSMFFNGLITKFKEREGAKQLFASQLSGSYILSIFSVFLLITTIAIDFFYNMNQSFTLYIIHITPAAFSLFLSLILAVISKGIRTNRLRLHFLLLANVPGLKKLYSTRVKSNILSNHNILSRMTNPDRIKFVNKYTSENSRKIMVWFYIIGSCTRWCFSLPFLIILTILDYIPFFFYLFIFIYYINNSNYSNSDIKFLTILLEQYDLSDINSVSDLYILLRSMNGTVRALFCDIFIKPQDFNTVEENYSHIELWYYKGKEIILYHINNYLPDRWLSFIKGWYNISNDLKYIYLNVKTFFFIPNMIIFMYKTVKYDLYRWITWLISLFFW